MYVAFKHVFKAKTRLNAKQFIIENEIKQILKTNCNVTYRYFFFKNKPMEVPDHKTVRVTQHKSSHNMSQLFTVPDN